MIEAVSIRRTILKNLMIVAAISCSLLFLLGIILNYRQFLHESEQDRRTFEQSQKEELRQQVLSVARLIRYRMRHTETAVEKTVRNRTIEAYNLASTLYREYHATKPAKEIQEIIKNALRNLRYNDGRGYYFIFNTDGVEELFADKPELEGHDMLSFRSDDGKYVVRDMIKLVQEKQQGFYEYAWTKPGRGQENFRKKAFVKLFAPYQWVIGTGEYVDDVRRDIQQEMLEQLIGLRFGADGYFFGSIVGGQPLFTNGKITRGNGSIWNITDPHGVKITQEYNKAIQNPGGGFVRYSWKKLDSPKPSPKISFVTSIPEWQWIIGAGIYLDTIEKEISQKKAMLLKDFANQALLYFLFLLFTLLLIYFWVDRITLHIHTAIDTFISFCRRAASQSLLIDPSTLKYKEFKEIAESTNAMLQKRQEVEEALRESEEHYRSLAESSQDYIMRYDRHGRHLYMNSAGLAVSGFSREDIIGKTHLESGFPEEQSAFWEESIKNVFTTGKPLQAEFSWESANGLVYLDWRLTPEFNEKGEVQSVLGVSRDITTRRIAEKEKELLQLQLVQAQKLEAIGTLAGGIAHDFNNILGAMIGYTDLVHEDSPEGSIAARHLKQVLKAGDRAKELVKQILTFSRQAEEDKILLDPAVIIKETLKLLRSSIPTTITILQELADDCPRVIADPTRLHQILMNLCTNAYHAMEANGGTLCIVLTKTVITDHDPPHESGLAPGNYVQLSIKDTGEGMAPEIQDKIFNPYFTTKEVGKGTGMGLAITHGIVKSYGGSIVCDSQPGIGTTFHIYLPACEMSDMPDVEADDAVPKGSNARILLIDDEIMLAEMSQVMLQRLGYRVTVRTDSRAALTTFTENPGEFDLVITDQTMPELTGIQLSLELLQIRPDIPIILCTGYSSLISEEQVLSLGIKGFAYKPLVKKDIAVLIKKVLGSNTLAAI